MANSQFSIPGDTYQEPSSLRETLHALDTHTYTPERQPEAFEFVKKLETEIDSYRDTAIALGQKHKQTWFRRLIDVAPKHPPVDMAGLINQEAYKGGKLFPGTHNTFWMHTKRDNPAERHIRDWFFNNDTNKNNVVTIHYETTADGLYKSYNGVEYPLMIDEIQHFTHAAIAYKDKVRQELYPLSDTIEELERDDLPFAA